MCIGSYLNKWCWTWTVLCRRHELQPGSTVRWHKLWQLPDTNLPRQLQYINVFHQRKNMLWETLSQVLFVESIEEKNIFFVHTTVLILKTAFNLVKIHLLFRIMILIQWSVNISLNNAIAQYFPVATHTADTKQFKFNITCSNESQYTCFIVGYGRRWHFGCKLWTLSLVDCYVQICNGTAVEHGSLLNCSGVCDGINCCKSVIITK
jgi:hypothetical protein